MVGDKGRHQVVNLHYILSKATVKSRPSVLWCYKKELGFSSHKQKRMKQLKKLANRSGTEMEKLQVGGKIGIAHLAFVWPPTVTSIWRLANW